MHQVILCTKESTVTNIETALKLSNTCLDLKSLQTEIPLWIIYKETHTNINWQNLKELCKSFVNAKLNIFFLSYLN